MPMDGTALEAWRNAGAVPTLVAAVDNDRMALLALRGILPQLLPGARWTWGVQTADEAVAAALDPDTRPRLLLVDMSLGESTGVAVCRRIRMRTDRVLLLAITAFSTATYADLVAEAGAQGIVAKADVPRLAAALRTVAAGGTYDPVRAGDGAVPASRAAAMAADGAGAASPSSPRFLAAAEAHRRLLDGAGAGAGPFGGGDGARGGNLPRLGAREAETLHLLSRGMSYEQIAAQWDVAASTVRTHAHRAVEKLGANSLAHAIALFLSR